MRTRNGAPHAVGVDQDRLAFVGEFIDHPADAALVFGVGPLEVGHFRTHQGFELSGPCMGALDPVAHRSDFPADGVRKAYDLLGRERFRFGEAHGDFCHRPRRQPHFLGAAHQRRQDEEQDDRPHGRAQRQQHFRAAGRCGVQASLEQPTLRNAVQAHRRPQQRSQAGHQKRCRTRALAQGLQHLPDGPPVVVGVQTGFRHQPRCRAVGIVGLAQFGRRGGGVLLRAGELVLGGVRACVPPSVTRFGRALLLRPERGSAGGLVTAVDLHQIEGFLDRQKGRRGRVPGFILNAHTHLAKLRRIDARRGANVPR